MGTVAEMGDVGAAPTSVITGGASGFGLAVAMACAANGMDVALLDIDAARVQDAAAQVREGHGVRSIGLAADVASGANLRGAAEVVAAELGRCDLLWANVGVQQFGAIEAISEEEWRWVLDVNVIGPVRTVSAFLPLLRSSASPRLAITASANALAPAERLGAYQASKYAVVGLAETLRLELAHDGIGVSVVYPSGMITRHLESSEAARPADLGAVKDLTDDLTAMMASRPMTELDLATAEDAAAAAVTGVLAGEPHVITHGDLDGPVAAHQSAIRAALTQVAERQHR